MNIPRQLQPEKAMVTKDSDLLGVRIWVMPLGKPLRAVKGVAQGKGNLECTVK